MNAPDEFIAGLDATPRKYEVWPDGKGKKRKWTMSDESNRGMFECEFGVRDLASNHPMQWHDAVWSEQGATWTWDGCNREGIIQPPGTYVGWIQWRNMETGKRGKHHCLIALAPP